MREGAEFFNKNPPLSPMEDVVCNAMISYLKRA